MRFLPDDPLYQRTDECLRFLRELDRDSAGPGPGGSERFHIYWRGDFSRKQAFAIKSFLATQDLDRCELWLWLDADDGYHGHDRNPVLRPLLPFVQVRRFDPREQACDTPLERSPDVYDRWPARARADFLRCAVPYRYGGVYADADMMFLRDMRVLLDGTGLGGEFSYQWSDRPWACSAILRLHEGSDVARGLLERCADRGSCHPKSIFAFDEADDLPLLVLPCPVFDPLWIHADHRRRAGGREYDAAPFNRFWEFFRPFGWRFRPKPGIRSYRDFFPGAFTYHWHNCWNAPEHEDSYFGLFEQEFDAILRDRLGVDVASGRASLERVH